MPIMKKLTKLLARFTAFTAVTLTVFGQSDEYALAIDAD